MMISTYMKRLLQVALGVGFLLNGGQMAFAQDAEKLVIRLDRSSGDVKVEGLKSPNALEELAKKKFIYLDLKILLDGKDKDAVLSSTEEAEDRYEVDCRPGNFGALTMGDGVEYYIQAKIKEDLIKASIYPGTRVTHTYNDAACVYDKRFKDKAVFHIRGFYTVVSNELPDGVAFQLRPTIPKEKDLKLLENE